MKRLAILFICSFILFSLLSCAQDVSKPAADITSQAADTTTQAATEEHPDIPETDMEGKTFTILINDYADYAPLNVTDINVEELSGEVLNDASFNRNKYMEQTYNCKIESVVFSNNEKAMSALQKAVKAGDTIYDICILRSSKFLSAITFDLLSDLNTIPYIDTSKPWWDSASCEALSLGNKNFGAIGDVTTGALNSTWITYFNKKLLADFGLENPYDLVKSGKWTIDKMYAMSKDVAADLNNDGKRDTLDRYGIAHIVDSPTSLLNSFGEKFVEVDSDGIPHLTLNTEAAYEKFIHITELFKDHDTFFNAHYRTSEAWKYEAQMFVNNQALFCLGGVYYGPEMRAMEEDYGILPYPKYNEEQDTYYNATVVVAIPIVTVPITNQDLNNTGILLEAYAWQGYKNVRPAFYDILLQRKVARDEQSAEIIDTIFDNIFIDIGAIYNFANVSSQINDMGCKGKTEIASYIEKSTPKIETEIQKLMDAMK
ncbi:MAG: hypothetical protein AB9835_05900 [Eubacteriales bacterium]